MSIHMQTRSPNKACSTDNSAERELSGAFMNVHLPAAETGSECPIERQAPIKDLGAGHAATREGDLAAAMPFTSQPAA